MTYSLAEGREVRAMYRRAGLCAHCHGQEPALPGLLTGANCQTQRNAYSRERYRAMPAEGRCYDCGGLLDRDGPTCNACLKKHRRIAREWGRARRASGQCQCGEPALPGQMRCAACRERGNAHWKAARRQRVAMRATCKHWCWRTTFRVIAVGAAGIKLQMKQTCRACYKRHEEVFWADAVRVADVFGRAPMEDA